MGETSEVKVSFGYLEEKILRGKGIDIGCGEDPLFPDVYRFDFQDGDANNITRYVQEEFDYVFSSHCLEHMLDPVHALKEWWQLVKLGGYMYIIVPDEDLYEKGNWPSINNKNHKFSFTTWKKKSWSPVSVNIVDLIKELPGAYLIRLAVMDEGDNYSLMFVLRKDAAEENKQWPKIEKSYPKWCRVFANFWLFSPKRRRAFRNRCR